MPSVNERTSKSGRVTYYVRLRDALGRDTTETFDTRKDAARFAKLVESAGPKQALAIRRRKDRANDDYVPTLAEMLVQHVDQLTGVTERTKADYLATAQRTWLPRLGDMDVDYITRTDVTDLINTLARRKLSAKSIANSHGILSSVLKTAVREGIIERNPCDGVRLPKSEATEDDIHFLTPEEYRSLLRAVQGGEPTALVALLFGSGLRWGEAIALTPADITDRGDLSFVRVTKAYKTTPGQGRHVGPPKSPKARRSAVLSTQARELIDPLLSRPKRSLLFTAPGGGPWWPGPFRDRIWVPAAIDAGLGTPTRRGKDGKVITPYRGPRIHDARHSHASWLISNGASLEMVQDQLGHESILTTRKVYGHLQPEAQNRLAEALTTALGAPRQIDAPEN